MRIGGSLLLIAIGAILRFAITTHRTHGVNIWAIGVILMIVGLVALVITGVYMMSRRRTDVIYRGPTGTTGTTYVTPNDPTNAPY
jgi:uncharacterized membrane protein